MRAQGCQRTVLRVRFSSATAGGREGRHAHAVTRSDGDPDLRGDVHLSADAQQMQADGVFEAEDEVGAWGEDTLLVVQ